MKNKVEYRFGRVMCKTGFMHVNEGLITNPEQVRNAFEALKLYRSYPGGAEWISDDRSKFISTEEKANNALDYLRENFNGSLKYAGDKPLDCMHGKIFFRKIAQLELTVEEEQQATQGLTTVLEISPEQLSQLTYGWR